MAKRVEVAVALGVSDRTIGELMAKGILPDVPARGQWDLAACTKAYIAHLREQAAGRAGSGDLDLVEERARLAKEQADRHEMENRARRGELLERAEVDAAVIGAFARVRARLLAVPGKLAPQVLLLDEPAEAEAAIRAAVCDALRELSSTNVADLSTDDSDMVAGSHAAA
jgi:phage terminase Nu1 subunit (DNA packaging protein)